jgi:hypothetical protein
METERQRELREAAEMARRMADAARRAADLAADEAADLGPRTATGEFDSQEQADTWERAEAMAQKLSRAAELADDAAYRAEYALRKATAGEERR